MIDCTLPGNLVDDCVAFEYAFGEPTRKHEWGLMERCGFPIGVDMKGIIFKWNLDYPAMTRQRGLPKFHYELVYSAVRRYRRRCQKRLQPGDTGLVLSRLYRWGGWRHLQPLRWQRGEPTLDMRLILEETMYLICLANLDDCGSVRWNGLKSIPIL